MTSRVFVKLLLLFGFLAVVLVAASEVLVFWKAALFAAMVAVGLAAVVAHLIARRLERIVAFAGSVARGDLSARINDRSTDEIAQLATVLDSTARELARNFESIETSRHQFETLLNGMQDPVIAVSREGRVQWANGAAERITGSAVRPGAMLVEVLRAPDLLEAVKQTLQSARPASCPISLAGAGRFFSLRCAPLPGGGCVVLLHDVTEIERVEKTRRDFIANVSHELRTPLTSIQGYAETLLDNEPQGARREFLEIIRSNAGRMARLTEDLLTLARVESGEQRFGIREVQASEIVREAERNFRELARTRQITLRCDSSDSMVLGDPDGLHQVFANLVENAIKYSPPGSEVVIGAIGREKETEFYVQDAGVGIPSEHLPRIFERFYRVDKARSREAGGTGLGLAIAKHIVKAHGGVLRAESTLNAGSRFSFRIPAAESAQGETPVVIQDAAPQPSLRL